jgi:hypothetical protein
MLIAIVSLAGMWIAMRPKPAAIDTFDVDPVEVFVDETVRLSWQSTNARSVTIETPEGVLLEGLPPDGSKTFKVTKTTTFYAYAVNEMGRSRSPLEATVVAKIVPKPPAAEIISFDVSPKTVNVGETATITYKVNNASKVTLQPLGVDLAVSGQDTYSFIAENPGKMTLMITAYNVQNQAVEKSVSLNVVDVSQARILVFQAMLNGAPLGNTEVQPATPIQIEWHVTNVARVDVQPPIGITTERGTMELLAPETTTTYTLTAVDAKGLRVTGKITIKVAKPPESSPVMGPSGGG